MPFFLGSGFLLAGLAIVVPIALHLLHRRRPQPLLFSAVRFMREAIAKSRRSRRITQGLTLLMRVLIILFLSLAFARPYVRQSGIVPAGRRVVLLVLDSSGSMQARGSGRSSFELGRNWAQLVLDSLQEGDRVGLLAPGLSEPRVVFPPVSDLKAVRSALQELNCGQGRGRVCETLLDILDKSKDAITGYEVHIFSDFQRSSWSASVAARLSAVMSEGEGSVFFNRVGLKSTSDAGFGNVQFLPPAVLSDGRFQAEVDVVASDSFMGSNTVRLVVGGEQSNHSSLLLSPGESEHCSLGGVAGSSTGADVSGWLELETDAYELNNRHYFSLPRLSGLPALLVNGSGDERDSYYLKRALNPGGVASTLMVPEQTDWSGFLSTGELTRNAVIFVCNPPALDATSCRVIKTYVETGGVLVLFPGGSGAGHLDEASLGNLGVFEGLKVKYQEAREVKRHEIIIADGSDLLARRLEAAIPPPWPFVLRRRLKLELPERIGASILKFRDGGSFLMRKRMGEGELWVAAVSANRDWSDWPLSPMFFIYIQELCKQAAGLRQRGLQTEVGGDLLYSWAGRELKLSLTLTAPDGTKTVHDLERDGLGKPFVINGFDSPGLYQLTGATIQGHRTIAVNIPEDERALVSFNGSELRNTMQGVPASYCEDHEELRRELSGMRQSRPLWPWLLLMAFLLSMVEVIFANVRSRPIGQPHLVGELLKRGQR